MKSRQKFIIASAQIALTLMAPFTVANEAYICVKGPDYRGDITRQIYPSYD